MTGAEAVTGDARRGDAQPLSYGTRAGLYPKAPGRAGLSEAEPSQDSCS